MHFRGHLNGLRAFARKSRNVEKPTSKRRTIAALNCGGLRLLGTPSLQPTGRAAEALIPANRHEITPA
jgi:hypothetical protein